MGYNEEKQRQLDIRYLRMARIWAENSYCVRRKVGALIVKDKMIISDGYNGTPSGFENICEDENGHTKPYVLHAEAVQRQRQERAKVDVNKLQASRMQAAAQAGQQDKQKPMPMHVEKKVGRNDPCPCGSGKKYKKCCGKNA